MRAIFWHDGRWYDEQPKLLGPLDHAMWMASVAFDGARAFEGVTPDLDRHCARLNGSAKALGTLESRIRIKPRLQIRHPKTDLTLSAINPLLHQRQISRSVGADPRISHIRRCSPRHEPAPSLTCPYASARASSPPA